MEIAGPGAPDAALSPVPTPSDLPRWRLVATLIRDGRDDLTVAFERSPITVGGSPQNDIVLEGPYVSRKHASVSVSGGRLIYRDHSSNGSFLNGQKIREVALKPTDVVEVPPTRLMFSLEVAQDHETLLLPPPGSAPLPGAAANVRDAVRSGSGHQSDAPQKLRTAPPRDRVHAFQLKLTRAPGALAGRAFTLERRDAGDQIVVGRARDADVCLDLQSISRRHLVFKLAAGGSWDVTDLHSRNGIEVNGTAVHTATLANGDEIAIGPDVTAVFAQMISSEENDRSGSPPVGQGPVTPRPASPGDDVLALTQQRSTVNKSVVVIKIKGRIDGYNYADFRDQLTQVTDGGDRLLILDFSGCTFCDHVGLGVVLNLKTTLDKRKGGLCLTGVGQMLREGLSLLRLDTLLAIEPDEAAAVRRLTKR